MEDDALGIAGSRVGVRRPPNSVQPASRAGWREWLAANHDRSDGVWLVTFKKSSGRHTLSYEDAVEEALCFGWIDSKGRALNEDRTMLWLSPRKPGTGWSKPNKERIERLIAAGLMGEAGMAKIGAAKRDGSWTKLDAVERLEVPPDLAKAFARHPGSRERFEGFPRSARRAILEWIVQAKREETRSKRVEETAALAAQGKRANQGYSPGIGSRSGRGR